MHGQQNKTKQKKNNNIVDIWYRGYLTLRTLSPATAKWQLLFYIPDYYIGLWSDNP